jgi:hypothetical protein
MHIFALGESMGAGIALQSAEVDSRIEAVEAEALFASLRQRIPHRSDRLPTRGIPASRIGISCQPVERSTSHLLRY